MEYNPVDQDKLYGRDLLVLESSPLPPLPESILAEMQNRYETELLNSPHLGRVVTRDEFRASNREDHQMLNDYRQIPDTLSVLGLPDREISTRILATQGVDLLGLVQVIQLHCEYCDKDSRIGLVSILLDSASAKIYWRVHISRDIEFEEEPDTLAAEADILGGILFRMLERLIEPKWHRQRFDHLRKTTS